MKGYTTKTTMDKNPPGSKFQDDTGIALGAWMKKLTRVIEEGDYLLGTLEDFPCKEVIEYGKQALKILNIFVEELNYRIPDEEPEPEPKEEATE